MSQIKQVTRISITNLSGHECSLLSFLLLIALVVVVVVVVVFEARGVGDLGEVQPRLLPHRHEAGIGVVI